MASETVAVAVTLLALSALVSVCSIAVMFRAEREHRRADEDLRKANEVLETAERVFGAAEQLREQAAGLHARAEAAVRRLQR